MPSSTVSFESGSTTVSITGPSGRQEIEPFPNYVTDLTPDGTRFVYKANSSSKRIWRLRFPLLTEAEKDDLDGFYRNTVNGPENQFTYTHTDGTAYTARFINPQPPVTRRRGPGLFSAEIDLEIDAAIS